MKRLLALLFVTVAACGGPDANAPGAHGPLAPLLKAALREEAIGDPVKAIDLYARALDAAAVAEDDPWAVPVALGALDALVHRNVAGFNALMPSAALADRVTPSALGPHTVQRRLADIEGHATHFVRSLIAEARVDLAERKGDVSTATNERIATGCVREALVAGPLSYDPVTGTRGPSVFERDGAIPGDLPGPGPFVPAIRPTKTTSFGCALPLNAVTGAAGVRDVVVDVDVNPGAIGLALRSSCAASLHVGGAVAIERPASLGSAAVTRFGRLVATKAGKLRVVARVAMDQDYTNIEIHAVDLATGKPLHASAPAIGTAGALPMNTIRSVAPIASPKSVKDEERLAVALGALGARDSVTAENVVFDDVAQEKAPPESLLVYARALHGVRDLPSVKANERARAAIERTIEAWPSSWEAAIEHAVLAGARRGAAEAYLEMIADLETARSKRTIQNAALLDAFASIAAGREHLYDRAKDSWGRAKGPLAGTPLLHEVDRIAFERTGAEQAAFDCAEDADRASLACHNARMAMGDRAGAERELERLRALAGATQLHLSLSTRSALEIGDLDRAAKLLAAMNPGDRALTATYAIKGKAAIPEILANAPFARDAPSALAALLRDAGDNPLASYEGLAERVVNDAATGALVANAATAVLLHKESYDLRANGLLHFVMIDVRRVMGTTDVDANAQAPAPNLLGRDALRILRRRIFKKDGRILLPDPTPMASQSHADLSQLEAGDAVEAIYEGFAVPGDDGNIGVDTPDLLPDRTAVREATIELTYPLGLRSSLWSHPLLGKPEAKDEGGRRHLVWQIKDRPVRRAEAGVPKMDRGVIVAFSTSTWDGVARGLAESIAVLDDDSPEVRLWARDAAKGQPPSKGLVEAIVVAAGQTVKEASGAILSDVDVGHSQTGTAVTARSILVNHEGSRTWLVVRALRELGVKTDVVVAENEPFSDTASFPPHYGRFMHPLAVAHVPEGDVWIDADVSGPPLPAGRISPELRGRLAITPSGAIAPLPDTGAAERDEIDIRLAVDDAGNAKGLLTVLLRGRSAQDLAEALVRLVGLERQRALRGIALAWVPSATVENVELSSTEGSWQVAIRAELSVPAYAQIEGQRGKRTWVLPGIDPIHYVFPRPYVTSMSATYASQGARESALAINRATQYHVRRRVELPKSAEVARLPGPFDGKGPLFSATRKLSVNGSQLEEDFALEIVTGTVPREKYDAFVAEAHRADDAFLASTRIKPPPGK